jgi:HSP20 family protein
MENFLERFFGEPELPEAPTLLRTWTPRVDVEEAEKEIVVRADIPGVEPKDVEVTVRDGVLVLHGEKKEEHEETKKNYRRLERFAGEFYREIPLPAGTDPEKITATGSMGVITVTIPRKPEVLPKKIAVTPVA